MLILIAVAAISAPATLLAQEACADPVALEKRLERDRKLAEKYAPVYWFGQTERYRPTMPFFTAFDGVNNNDNQTIDFKDPKEMAPTWEMLNSIYKPKTDGLAAIFYRVRQLDSEEVSDMWRYLISDEQAWQRFDIEPDILNILRGKDITFESIEFYAYYLSDFGLIGHPHDVEFVYVLAPTDTLLAPTDSLTLADRFRIVIGAGHTPQVPNNVLVLSGALADENEQLNVNVIVELGDHSSAPDVDADGAFTLGLDANWHAYDVWGTRDVQASGGLGATGRYEPWMTFPRTRRDILLPPLPLVDVTSILARHDTVASKRGGMQFQPSDERESKYTLIAAWPLECAFRELEETPQDITDDSLIDKVERWFKLAHAMSVPPPNSSLGLNINGFKGLKPDQKEAAVLTLRRWNQQGLKYRSQHTLDSLEAAGKLRSSHSGRGVTQRRSNWIGPEKVLVWKSDHYRDSPIVAFKQHLFRPVVGAVKFRKLPRFWITGYAGNALLLQTGLEIPAFWLPIRLPGYLELHAGFYFSCTNLVNSCFARNSFAASLLHTNDYRSLSWYTRVSFIPRRAEVDGDLDTPDWLLSGGLSIPIGPVRIRTGLSTDLTSKGPQFDTTRWELIVSPLYLF